MEIASCVAFIMVCSLWKNILLHNKILSNHNDTFLDNQFGKAMGGGGGQTIIERKMQRRGEKEREGEGREREEGRGERWRRGGRGERRKEVKGREEEKMK